MRCVRSGLSAPACRQRVGHFARHISDLAKLVERARLSPRDLMFLNFAGGSLLIFEVKTGSAMGKDGNLEPATPDDADLLRLVLESAKDFAVFAENASGEVILWNAGAEQLTGYSQDDILRLGADATFTPEDRAAGAADHERSQALRTGRSEDERWHQRKD